MARYFKTLLPFYLCAFLLLSCQEGHEAGDLLGQWRMTGSDTKYIAFSGSVTMVRSLTEGQVAGAFQHVGDSLFMQCYSVYGDAADTLIVEHTFGFKPIDNIRVRIQSLSSDQLILTKDDKTWTFDKY